MTVLTVPKAPIKFVAFDELTPVRIYYHGILPHWRQCGCTYFVTFRLADSIPQGVLNEIEYERCLWLKAHGIEPKGDGWKRDFAKLPANERRIYERLLGTLVNQSLDECHGCCALREPKIGRIIADALDHFHGTRVWTGDFVIMPNHVHALLTPKNDYELEDILHSIKSFTAKTINKSIGRSGCLWQRESYDHIVRDTDQLEAFQQYTAANPVKAKLPAGQYIHSRAEYQVL